MTLAFNHIGRLGQLGNQMFQYASLKGIAKHRGFDYMVPVYSDTFVDSLGNKLRTELFNPFNLKVNIGSMQTEKYLQEPHFQFSQELFNTCPDNISLYGFFQTEKYFNHIRDDILKDFNFKDEIKDECEPIIEEFDDPIGLHIRRGDFLINYKNHHNLTLDYYDEALKKFDDNRQVVIFSDDPEWCNEQNIFDNDRFLISKDNGPYHDLYMMTKCNDFIIANSTYSWWGAWLSDNIKKKVIAPKRWFGVNNEDKNIDDLFPSDWILI